MPPLTMDQETRAQYQQLARQRGDAEALAIAVDDLAKLRGELGSPTTDGDEPLESHLGNALAIVWANGGQLTVEDLQAIRLRCLRAVHACRREIEALRCTTCGSLPNGYCEKESDVLAGPEPEPPAREPVHDRFTPPDPAPETVRCCPYCGIEVTGRPVGRDETVDACPDHGIVEGQAIEVLVEVFEAGPEAVLAFLATLPTP